MARERRAGGRRWLVGVGCAASIVGGIISAAPAQVGAIAQLGTVGGVGAPAVEPPPVATGRPDVFVRPGRVENALIAGDWLIYPSAFAGFIFDSNVSQTTAAKSSAGVRVVPSFLAEANDGISKTTLYGVADGRLYFEQRAGSSDQITVRSGVIEAYQPLPDLRFTGQADFTRQKDLFSTLGVTNSVNILNPTGVGLAPTSSPQSYNQISGSGSVQKNFAGAFAILGVTVVDQMYDKSSGVVAPSPDGVTYVGTGRGGVWLTPAVYGYLEASGDKRDFATGALSSTGYRIVGGLGTDQIGLLKGEIFGGVQSESFRSAAIGTVTNPVFGGRITYYPLPELTINLSADEAIGATLLAATPTSPAGTSTKVTSVLATAGYSIAPEWSATGRAGYIHTDYSGAVRRDDAWTVGGTLGYNFWRNVALTADFQHLELSSNAALASFSRDIVTLGVTYKY
jgi:hypothetical protein